MKRTLETKTKFDLNRFRTISDGKAENDYVQALIFILDTLLCS